MEGLNYETETWKIINKYFEDNPYFLTNHHLESFNDFIDNKIPETLKQINPIRNFKEYDNSRNSYKYQIDIYFGTKSNDKIYIGNPIIYDKNNGSRQLFPNEARIRNLDYSSSLCCDVEVIFKIFDGGQINETSIIMNKINIGKIPIMLHSKYCVLNNQSDINLRNMGESSYEKGGYFIIKGKEKVIISQEKMALNKIYLVKNKEDEIYTHYAEVKSVSENDFKPPKTSSVLINNKNKIMVSIPYIKKNIPLFIVFRALGIETDKEIMEYIFYDIDNNYIQPMIDYIRFSVSDNGPINTQKKALFYLSTLTRQRTRSNLLDVLYNDFFPHVGKNLLNKAYYLGHVVNKLLKMKFNIIKPTDRDSFSFKRVELSGFLLAKLYRDLFTEFTKRCLRAIDNEYNYNKVLYQGGRFVNVINQSNKFKIFNANLISNSLMKSLKGNWIGADPGIVQDLDRKSFLGTLSHLRRLNQPNVRHTKLVPPRRQHTTTWGILCPIETPDGGNIGTIKHFSIMAYVSFGSKTEPIINLLRENKIIFLKEIKPRNIYKVTKVFINGKWIGVHYEPDKLVHILRLYRRNGLINIYISISWDIKDMEINIWTDSGRFSRPVYIVENKDILLNQKIIDKCQDKTYGWSNIISGFADKTFEFDNYNEEYFCPEKYINLPQGKNIIDYLEKNKSIVEYLDVEESDTSTLVTSSFHNLNKNFTHSELHSSIILGILALCIPFAEHNPAVRNLFSSGQTKQAVSMYTSNFRHRMDQAAVLLSYPQRPLITTRFMKYINKNKLPYGENAIVAIASYTGYNQEDAIIVNKSSLQRGMFRTTYFRTYSDTEKAMHNDTDSIFCNPTKMKTSNIQIGKNYEKLDSKGFIEENMKVTDKDIIKEKCKNVILDDVESLIDCSLKPKKNTNGFVHKVFIDKDEENYKSAKVCIREERIPELGDKFSSRAGQKGTIGMIYDNYDMPYTKDGIVPDIIVNPHAIPSRMTLGQLIECVYGKVTALNGSIADATPFTNGKNPIKGVSEALESLGYQSMGNEILYNGQTGKQLPVSIFIGPTYYMRLKHLVHDKMYSRSQGPRQQLTRQPTAGRARNGGLRIGEMERDVIISHGASSFLKETFYERSDGYKINVSKKSGLIVSHKTDKKNISENDIAEIKIPYSTKLMMQELIGMSITPRLLTE